MMKIDEMNDTDFFKAAARTIGDMRFVQAASITALHLEGKAYNAAKSRMNELAAIQKRLEALAQKAVA